MASVAVAFQAARPAAPRASSLKMAEIDESMPGILAPVGFFDPLNLSKYVGEGEVRRYREVEIKHGRIAMLGALGMLVQEFFHPLFGGEYVGPAVFHFQEVATKEGANWWYIPLLLISFAEADHIKRAYETPAMLREQGKVLAGIREDHMPGDLGFDPLGLAAKMDEEEFLEKQNKELNNGRLAMIGWAGIVSQELVNAKTVAETLQG